MPLCTTAILPFCETCGWELMSFGSPCGRPAGMADAERAGQGSAPLSVFAIRFCSRPLAFSTSRTAVLLHADASGVITPVFQPRQTLQQNAEQPAACRHILRYHTYEIVPPVIIMLQDKRAEICLILRSKPLCFAVTRIFADFVTRTECARERIRRIFDRVPPRYPAWNSGEPAGAWRL